VSAIDGVRFSSIAAGVKYQGRDDVMLAEICEGASIAGLFTKSATRSANVLDCQAKLGRVEAPDKGFAIIVNSGNSNAFTGRAGDASVARICDGVSDALGVPTRHVYTASTGVIGERIAGFAKGSGMIAPDMATMLVYIFTDAKIAQPDLQAMIAQANETSFNAITVDSDTSTSDSLMVVATGRSADVTDSPAFSDALASLMTDLAHQVVSPIPRW